MTTILDADDVSRVALLHLTDGSAQSLEDAERLIRSRHLTICVSREMIDSAAGQAALLTAVVTAIRTFGAVHVSLPADALVRDGVHRGRQLRDALHDEGAKMLSGYWNTGEAVVVIGGLRGDTPPASAAPVLYASWDGWMATVSPTPRPAEQTGNVLAAVTAAALAVSEAFAYSRKIAGSDAGYQELQLNLLGPGNPSGPDLRYAPASWWLVGLGHLGQAYAWVIAHVPYEDPGLVEVTLQDIDRTSPANHSTSVLTPVGSRGVAKTRVVAGRLETAGLSTRIIERPLDAELRLRDGETQTVALIGVDNLPTRRTLSSVGWPLTIDMGLGAREQDHTAISMHRLPGSQESHAIPAWQDRPETAPSLPPTPGFTDLDRRFDQCGVVTLAGKAIGVPSVGIIAATLAVSEAVKQMHGIPGVDVAGVDVATGRHVAAPAARHARISQTALRPS